MDNNATENGFNELIGFKTEIERLQSVLEDFEAGQKSDVALIAEPFAGRTTLINMVDKLTSQAITKVSLSALVTNEKAFAIPKQSKGIVIVDNCHFLYQRSIGGFQLLDEFLETVVSSDTLFITTWNIFLWNYLDEVVNIGRFFPVKINLPKFSTAEIKELILTQYGQNELEFVDDSKPEEKRIVTTMRYPIALKRFEKTISIPFFHVDFARIKFRLSRKEETKKAEDIIFELIQRSANGNPGVARLIWEKSLEYPTIKPSYVKECSFKIDVNYTESFVLYLILSMEALTEEELTTIAGERDLGKTLHRLVQQHLIITDNESYKLNPEALRCIVDHVKKTGVIW